MNRFKTASKSISNIQGFFLPNNFLVYFKKFSFSHLFGVKDFCKINYLKTKENFIYRNLLISLIIFGMISFFTIGCATIMKGTEQDISIQSNPSNAKVVVKTTGGVEVWNGVTPATVKLSKKKEYVVTVQLSGYKDATVQITQSFEAWAIGNLICGGVVGIVVDAVDGAIWKLEPDQIMVTLSTALLENGEPQLYAVFYTMDNEGQLRSMAIPLIKDNNLVSNK